MYDNIYLDLASSYGKCRYIVMILCTIYYLPRFGFNFMLNASNVGINYDIYVPRFGLHLWYV